MHKQQLTVVSETAPPALGICATCSYAAGCAHRIRNAHTAIWNCENYDDYYTVEIPVSPRAQKVGVEAGTITEARVVGLCVNCIRRQTCAFPRLPGGVWHCEEYE